MRRSAARWRGCPPRGTASWFARAARRPAPTRCRPSGARRPASYYTDDDGTLALAGLQFGNVFVAVQPPRGYGMDKTAIMHKPDLPPTYPYHALYRWLAEPADADGFGADAVVHMGKHGSLEWLPGKGVGPLRGVLPGPVPGRPAADLPVHRGRPRRGRGGQAAGARRDRRPPAAADDDRRDLRRARSARAAGGRVLPAGEDRPGRLPLLQEQIRTLLAEANLEGEIETLLREHAEETGIALMDDPLSLTHFSGEDFAHVVEDIHAYMYELGMAPIRDGLHILGTPPDGDSLIDSVMMLVRLRNGSVPSLRDSVGAAYGFDLRTAAKEPGARVPAIDALGRRRRRDDRGERRRDRGRPGAVSGAAAAAARRGFRRLGDRRRDRDGAARCARRRRAGPDAGVARRSSASGCCRPCAAPTRRSSTSSTRSTGGTCRPARAARRRAAWPTSCRPAATSTRSTRARSRARPPGRSGTTWRAASSSGTCARRARSPRASASRSGAPRDAHPRRRHRPGAGAARRAAASGRLESRRVVGVEVIPLDELGRPRIDVVCRISGFFRDAFPHVIALLDEAVRARLAPRRAAGPELRPRATGSPPTIGCAPTGWTRRQAWRQAGYRIFGSKPGTYGAGILPLIDEQAWRDDADLAETYVNWGGYAYTREEYGVDARGALPRGARAGARSPSRTRTTASTTSSTPTTTSSSTAA